MRGEVIFDAGGQRFTLFLGNAAQCAIEQQYDRGFFAVVADAMPELDPAVAMAVARSMSEGSELPPALAAQAVVALRHIRLSVLRDLAWHGLREHHPTITLAQVSAITDELGREAFGDIIGRALRAARGNVGEAGDEPKPGNEPPPASPKKPAKPKR